MKFSFLRLIAFIMFACSVFVLYSCDNDKHSHSLTHQDAIPPTCTQDGNVEYWHCSACDKIFSDEKAENEIENIVVPSSHTLVHNEAMVAGCAENGNLEHWLCTECHVKFSDSAASTVVYNVFLPGEHRFVNGVCEECASEGTPELIYELIDGQYTVTGIEDSDALRIVIPSSYNEIPVVAIAENAFKNCSELRSLEISESITKMGNGVFDGCEKLVEIINKSNLNISKEQGSFTEIHQGETKLKNVNGYLFYVFGDTDSVLVGYTGDESELMLPEEFVIDDSIRILLPCMVIAEDFENTFIIPLLEKFESLLVKYCNSVLPDTNFSFFNNENYVQYEDGYIQIKSVNKYLSDMRKIYQRLATGSARDEYKELDSLLNDILKLMGSYSLWNPQTFIGQEGHEGILDLIHKNYPITKDGTAVYALSESVLKESISAIIKRHFSDYNHQIMYEQERACGYVHNTYAIHKIAFSGRTDLTGITIPNGVTDIANEAFDGFEKLVNITVKEGNAIYSSTDGNLYSADGKTLIRYAPGKEEESFVIPHNVEAVWRYAFKDHNLKSIVIPEGVTEIKPRAFSELYSQEDNEIKIILPKTLKKIGESAFSNTPLTEITLPEGLVEIGNHAFVLTGLKQIHIPASVESIGIGVFGGNEITSITVDENNTVYHIAGNCLIHTAQKLLVFGATNAQIPDDGSVEIIGCEAFVYLPAQEPIHIPSSVLYIMNGAFYGTYNFSGLTYDGDTFFFVEQEVQLENGIPVVKYLYAEDYDIENQMHNRMLSGHVISQTDLYRSEEKIEYYIQIYKNYTESLNAF